MPKESPLDLLFSAISELDIKAAKAALKKDPSVVNQNRDEEFGTSPMHEICMDVSEAAFSMLKFFVEEANGDVNLLDREGETTPLSCAIDREDAETVKYLLEKGARLSTERFNATVAAACNPEVLKIVLEKGGDINARCSNTGKTPALMAALSSNDEPSELIPILKEAGADFFTADANKKNILHMCAMNAKSTGGGAEWLKVLMEHGILTADGEKVKAMVNARDGTPGQFTPLHDAVSSENVGVVEILLGQFNADRTLKTAEADDEPEKTALDILAEWQETLEEEKEEDLEWFQEEMVKVNKIKALLE